LQARPNFLLSKWYLDCVSDAGELFIAYVATVRWQGVTINYSSAIHRQSDGRTKTKTSLRDSPAPQVAGPSIEWSSSYLDVGGTWRALARPVQRVLLESAAGRLEWNCLQPNAEAEIRMGKGQRLQGLGYVEHLTMSIPPWQLPIQELCWGRFLSNTEALVWIDWQGATPLNLVFHNGNQIEDVSITDRGFKTGELALALEENAVVREGPLIKTTLSTIPGIRRLFPLRVLRTYECKWLSHGTLKKTGGEEVNGWAIHEVVRWA
jgi:hypothetical protein